MAALMVAVAGCGDSSDDADATDTDATDTGTTGSAPTVTDARPTDTADQDPTPATDEPMDSGRTVASIAVVPGWESIAEPLLAGIADSSDTGVTFELDVEWMDSNAGEDIELRLLEAVASGDLDAALVGVRALSALDLAGFDVLVAPRLVDSYEVQEAVLADGLADRLLPELDAIGVVGMAFVPGPMRYPIGVERPFVTPEDFAGATFHTFPAEQNATTAEALGAVHSQLWGGERDAALDDGTIDVTENGMEWMWSNGRGSHLTLDPLWPATGVFVVSPALVADLSTSQIEAVTAAIGSASSTAADLVTADTELAAELCAAGKQFATSSADDLTAMLDALQPVYEALTADSTAGPLLDEVRALKETITPTRPTVPEDCEAAVEEAPTATGLDDPSVLDGSYQLEWTVEELMTAVPEIDERTARGNDGVFVLTFDDGTFDMVWQDDPVAPCGGTYGVTGDRVQLVASRDLAVWTCGGESLGAVILDAAWRLDGDQLVLSDFVLSEEPDITWWNAAYFSKPLTRIG